MRISKELELTLANDAQNIKSIVVVYKSGATISGFVKSAKFLPLQVILWKHETEKGELEYEYLDFVNASKITIFYYDGKSMEFE